MIEVSAVSNLHKLCLFPEQWGQNINLMQDLEKNLITIKPEKC